MGLSKITAAFQSKQAFLDFVHTAETLPNQKAVGNARWSNKDLEPTPPESRTWTWYNLPLYWGATAFGASGWNVAASLVAVGLTWQHAFASCVLGSFICAWIVVLMARAGARYHVGFPVQCRSAMGMYGSIFFVVIRAIVAVVWYGVQTYYGANLMSTCLRCMFGDKWKNFANQLPPSADVTSKQLLCFFLVWIMQFPLTLVHPSKIHYLFTVKGVFVPIVTFGLFGWCMANGTGLSQIDHQIKTKNAEPLGWAIMNGINVIMGTLSPLLINQPDLSRYCRKPSDAGVAQGIAVFASKILVFFMGLASTSSMQGVYGKAYWNIWDLLEAILDHNWTPGARCAVFIAAFAYLFSVFGTNLGSNSIPFGADMTGVFPRWLTIRRGQILCSILSICIVPWKLIATAKTFLSFLGSYNIFMAPLCGVLIVDYFYARKGNIHVPSLYNGTKNGLYWFTSGVNVFGVMAWCGAISLGLPGLIATYNSSLATTASLNMYKLGWVLTFITSCVLNTIFTTIRRPVVYPDGFQELPVTWEYLAQDGKEGFFDGERDTTSTDADSSSDLDGKPEAVDLVVPAKLS